jgi:hypothetical protein
MTQDTPKKFFRIYGKAPSQANYKAMNLGEGIQTSNLIYATMLSQAEAQRALQALQTAEPAWSWQIREVK